MLLPDAHQEALFGQSLSVDRVMVTVRITRTMKPSSDKACVRVRVRVRLGLGLRVTRTIKPCSG